MRTLAFAAVALPLLSGCAHSGHATPIPSQAIVDAPDRTEKDRAMDAGRKPAAFLDFIGLAPGMKAAELMAAGGYTTELLARAVGPQGVVYGENPRGVLENFAEKPWSERLARPVMKNVVRADRELDDPLPKDATNLDVVVSNVIYHDAVWMNVNRQQMNESVLKALKPGGAYVVCDSSARTGRGTQDAEALHRIDEQVVRDEVTHTGFQVAAEGSFLRNPDDTRDWNASPRAAADRRGTNDRFCLKFVKP